MTHPTFFEMRAEAEEFDRSLIQVIRLQKDGQTLDVFSGENVHRYSHGGRWAHRANKNTVVGEMTTASAEHLTPFQDILNCDIGLINRTVRSVSKQMHEAQMRLLYQTVSDSCDAHGQTVSEQDEGSKAMAFLAMLRRIEFGVDRDGNVSLPQIHAGPDTIQALLAELSSQPPEFEEEVERIKAEKSELALARERERLGRFKQPAKP